MIISLHYSAPAVGDKVEKNEANYEGYSRQPLVKGHIVYADTKTEVPQRLTHLAISDGAVILKVIPLTPNIVTQLGKPIVLLGKDFI